MNGKPENAWDLYISMDNHLINISILTFISAEFYRMGCFYYAFKAYLFLERFSPSDENTKGKFASAVGLFYLVMDGKAEPERLQEIIGKTSNSVLTEENMQDVLREIRRALLEADVNFKVAKNFVDKVKARRIIERIKYLTVEEKLISKNKRN